MKLNIVTIVLNGQPYISQHLKMLQSLAIDWHWFIVEGVAAPVADTFWIQKQDPGLSTDGTTEYLDSIDDPRVTVIRSSLWGGGKTEMVNAPLPMIKKESVLLQMDSDEFWTKEQLERMVDMFEKNFRIMAMQFYADYRVGPNIRITSNNTYGNKWNEWVRAWRFRPTMLFNSHEPPVLNNGRGYMMNRDETREAGLVFLHQAYTTESQLRFKERVYNYKNAYYQWRMLQDNTEWPVNDLKQWLPWVGDGVTADLVK